MLPLIQQFLEKRDFTGLRDFIGQLNPPTLADIISQLPPNEQAVIFRILPQKIAAATFEYIDINNQEELLKALGKNEVAAILNDMSPDDRTQLLEELPGEVTKKLLMLLSPDERKVALTFLGYPEDSIGRMMTSDYIAVPPEWTVKQVLDHIRQSGQDSETLNVIYVIDKYGLLIDDIRVREFLLAPLDKRVDHIMTRQFVTLKATDNQETAIEIFKRYDRVALPVTDTQGVLIGIVTIDDIFDVAEEEATEDIQRIGGMQALDEPYTTIPLPQMIRKRAGWLVILFIGETFTATAMGFFEDEISKAVVLALFIPLIISSGGNSGSQAATLVIRALALGEIKKKDVWRVIRREAVSGLLLGTVLGTIGFVRIALWSSFSTVYGPHWIQLAWTVFFSLIGVVLWGTLSGATLPLLLKRAGLDPATSSAPFVATLVDVTGLVIYFFVASILLHGILL